MEQVKKIEDYNPGIDLTVDLDSTTITLPDAGGAETFQNALKVN